MWSPIMAAFLGEVLMIGGIVIMVVLWVAVIVAWYFRKQSDNS